MGWQVQVCRVEHKPTSLQMLVLLRACKRCVLWQLVSRAKEESVQGNHQSTE
jgi:hypothetical protein